MRHEVRFVGWAKGESIATLPASETAPYVPPLKSAVEIGGVHYVVGGIESVLMVEFEASWLVFVKLARS